MFVPEKTAPRFRRTVLVCQLGVGAHGLEPCLLDPQRDADQADQHGDFDEQTDHCRERFLRRNRECANGDGNREFKVVARRRDARVRLRDILTHNDHSFCSPMFFTSLHLWIGCCNSFMVRTSH